MFFAHLFLTMELSRTVRFTSLSLSFFNAVCLLGLGVGFCSFTVDGLSTQTQSCTVDMMTMRNEKKKKFQPNQIFYWAKVKTKATMTMIKIHLLAIAKSFTQMLCIHSIELYFGFILRTFIVAELKCHIA